MTLRELLDEHLLGRTHLMECDDSCGYKAIELWVFGNMKMCEACDGRGMLPTDGNSLIGLICPTCRGSGRVGDHGMIDRVMDGMWEFEDPEVAIDHLFNILEGELGRAT